MKIGILLFFISLDLCAQNLRIRQLSELQKDLSNLDLWKYEIDLSNSILPMYVDWDLGVSPGTARLVGVSSTILGDGVETCETLGQEIDRRNELVSFIKDLKTQIFQRRTNGELNIDPSDVETLNLYIGRLNRISFDRFYKERRQLSYHYDFSHFSSLQRGQVISEVKKVHKFKLWGLEWINFDDALENIHGFKQHSYIYAEKAFLFIKREMNLVDYCLNDLSMKLEATVTIMETKFKPSFECKLRDLRCQDRDILECIGYPINSQAPRIPEPFSGSIPFDEVSSNLSTTNAKGNSSTAVRNPSALKPRYSFKRDLHMLEVAQSCAASQTREIIVRF